MQNRLIDLKAGILTRPKRSDIIFSLVVFTVYSICTVIIGLMTGFFTIELFECNIWVMILMPISLLVIPSIPEEFFFRALLLPHKQNTITWGRKITFSIISITLFVMWHPFTALTIYRSVADIFTDPVFLSIVTLLAITCTVTYLKSGSVWIPVAIHWASVMAWMYLLGGRNFVFC